ncbi:MAG: hypothetical protein B6I25_05405 [Planctomycetales bacterium 4572_13]|nr:MAG: hypothetical protein B6I25_05405 [Planctomycetales bacterium 4572_13]
MNPRILLKVNFFSISEKFQNRRVMMIAVLSAPSEVLVVVIVTAIVVFLLSHGKGRKRKK